MKYLVLILCVIGNLSFAKEKNDKKKMIVFFNEFHEQGVKTQLFGDKKISKYIKDNYNVSFFLYKRNNIAHDYMFKKGVMLNFTTFCVYNNKDEIVAKFNMKFKLNINTIKHIYEPDKFLEKLHSVEKFIKNVDKLATPEKKVDSIIEHEFGGFLVAEKYINSFKKNIEKIDILRIKHYKNLNAFYKSEKDAHNYVKSCLKDFMISYPKSDYIVNMKYFIAMTEDTDVKRIKALEQVLKEYPKSHLEKTIKTLLTILKNK